MGIQEESLHIYISVRGQDSIFRTLFLEQTSKGCRILWEDEDFQTSFPGDFSTFQGKKAEKKLMQQG